MASDACCGKKGLFFMKDVEGWMIDNIKNKEIWRGVGCWQDVWAIGCHCVWNWRNKELHEGNYVRPLDPMSVITRIKGEYDKAMVEHKL